MSHRNTTSRRARLIAGLALAALAVGATGGLTATAPAEPATASAPAHEGKDVILNLFQWTWNSVAAECTTTIGPAGFGYVQVSPPQESVQGTEWWTSYQPVSYRIESKLGTRAEFADMVATCNQAGVGVIADAVINHMSGADRGSGTGVAGSAFGVDSFPAVPYGYNDFNDCRSNITNYSDRYNVQNCRLVSLQDLRTGSEYVRQKIADYLNDLIALGVDGFRIDAAKHIPASDLVAIKQKLSDPDIYWVQEVIGAPGEPIQPSEYLGSGDAHEFAYARALKSAFNGSIANLEHIQNGLLPSANAGVFVDNHDTERNGETMNYKWGAKYLLGNVFMLSYPYGSPSVYSGYTFTNTDAGAPGASGTSVPDANCGNSAWVCTQRMQEISGMVGFHNAVAGAPLTNWWDDGSNLVGYGRGNVGYVALNNSGSQVTHTFTTSLPAGSYCNVVSAGGCAQSFTVVSGQVTLTIPAYGAVALHTGGTDPGTDPGGDTGDDTTTVYYSTAKGWSAYNIHYRVGNGDWTTVPGLAMSAACNGWVSRPIETDGATITAAFNNNAGTWDNNHTHDYTLSGQAVAVSASGAVTPGDPCDSGGASGATFTVSATAASGQGVYVVGDITALGSWAPANAVALTRDGGVWTGTVALPAGTTFQYKYIKRDAGGGVVWESGPNHTATVGANGQLALTDSWRY